MTLSNHFTTLTFFFLENLYPPMGDAQHIYICRFSIFCGHILGGCGQNASPRNFENSEPSSEAYFFFTFLFCLEGYHFLDTFLVKKNFLDTFLVKKNFFDTFLVYKNFLDTFLVLKTLLDTFLDKKEFFDTLLMKETVFGYTSICVKIWSLLGRNFIATLRSTIV